MSLLQIARNLIGPRYGLVSRSVQYPLFTSLNQRRVMSYEPGPEAPAKKLPPIIDEISIKDPDDAEGFVYKGHELPEEAEYIQERLLWDDDQFVSPPRALLALSVVLGSLLSLFYWNAQYTKRNPMAVAPKERVYPSPVSERLQKRMKREQYE